jgi:hypothetical protein
VVKLFPFTTVKVHNSGLAKRTSVSRWKAVRPIGGASGLVSVPNLPESSSSLFSQLTIRNQSRVSFGVEETANLLWDSHPI